MWVRYLNDVIFLAMRSMGDDIAALRCGEVPSLLESPLGYFLRHRLPCRQGETIRLVFIFVDELILGDPRHHRTQISAHTLDRVGCVEPPVGRHRRIICRALGDELLGIFTVLNILQRRTHGLT